MGSARVGAREGVELGFLKSSEVCNFSKLGALQLALLIRFAGWAVAFEAVSSEDVVGARLGFGLFDDFGFGDGVLVEVDEGDFLAFQPAGFCCEDAFNAADGELASPKAVLRECDFGRRSCFWLG